MNGLIEDIKFSKYTTYSVNVIEDYNVPGSFRHDAACDIDYYGYRDTDFVVTEAWCRTAVGSFQMSQEELEFFVEKNHNTLLLQVQDMIDKTEK